MATSLKLLFLLVLLLMIRMGNGFAQRMDHEDRMRFADSVTRIIVWTYLPGDTGYRRYQEAMDALKETLNKKGYEAILVRFDGQQGIPAQIWKNNNISRLKKNEAFLEVTTLIKKDTSIAASDPYSHVNILNTNGAIIATRDKPGLTDSVLTRYFSEVVSKIYVNWQLPPDRAFIAIYSKKEEVTMPDIGLAVTYSLSDIPNSKHPVVVAQKEPSSKNRQTRLEFIFFGGYILASRMDVAIENEPSITGTAEFAGNAQYGVEASIGLIKYFNIFILYRRLQTMIRVNTPNMVGYGDITSSQNFYEVGINYNITETKVVSPYIGIAVGALNLVPKDKYFRDVWYFITGAQGGVKFYLSKSIGFRLQAEMLYQVHPTDAPFLYSMDVYNKPCSSMSNMLQFGLSGGLIFRVGN